MLKIYLHELKTNFKSLLIWGLVIGLLILVAVGKYSAFHGNPDTLQILDSMPVGLLDALNMRSFNLTTLEGFFGAMFNYFGLMGAMAAAMWGSEVISKEERDRTVEFSLVLPVTRSKVVTAKLLAALTNCGLLVIITGLISILSVQTYTPDKDFYEILRLEMRAMYFMELIFLAIGILLGCALKQYKRAGSTAIAIILGTYFLYIISRMHENLDFLRFFSPFRWYDAGEFFKTGFFENGYLTLTGVTVVGCLLVAYWVYDRRDLMI